MTREIIVFGKNTFKIKVPDDSKLTFGPWSPSAEGSKYGNSERALNGTLRVYGGKGEKESVLAVFSGVTGYRDTSLDYEEKTSIETGSVVWKSDKKGYFKEESVQRDAQWENPELASGEVEIDFKEAE